MIDYLQLMSSNREGENRATEISEVSRSIKSLAKELQVPILALSLVMILRWVAAPKPLAAVA